MRAFRCLAIALYFVAYSNGASFAGSRSSGSYSINDTVDASGGRNQSASYKNDSSIGGIGGVSVVASPAETMKHGYVGQLYDVAGFVLDAAPATINEGGTRQVNPFDLLDDQTRIAVNPFGIGWAVLSDSLQGISSTGVVTASLVYQNTPGTLQGQRNSYTATLMLNVLNVNTDDFGIYAGDQIDDAWQVQYFGEENPNGLATADPDGDGQNNKFEYVAGLVPNSAASRFLLRIGPVAGQPGQKQLIFSPRLVDRTYTPKFRPSLTSGSWLTLGGTNQSDNGSERTVTDVNAAGTNKFYEVEITKP